MDAKTVKLRSISAAEDNLSRVPWRIVNDYNPELPNHITATIKSNKYNSKLEQWPNIHWKVEFEHTTNHWRWICLSYNELAIMVRVRPHSDITNVLSGGFLGVESPALKEIW